MNFPLLTETRQKPAYWCYLPIDDHENLSRGLPVAFIGCANTFYYGVSGGLGDVYLDNTSMTAHLAAQDTSYDFDIA